MTSIELIFNEGWNPISLLGKINDAVQISVVKITSMKITHIHNQILHIHSIYPGRHDTMNIHSNF